jgi:hypothetical protein
VANAYPIAGLVLVAVGILLILLGAYITLKDWNRKLEGKTGAERNALEGTLDGLAKLLKALQGYPLGQQLIVWGIVLLFLGGLFGGVAALK